MKFLIDLISEQLSGAFEKAGFDAAYGRATLSNRPDLCEYQCNGALAAAKKYHKAPIQIANAVLEALGENEMFASAEAVMPGFLNLKISDEYLAAYLRGMDADAHYGVQNDPDACTIVLDYGGPNVAKPLHVGHLRSAIIGESLKRIYRFFGNHVIGDIHLGDWGLQMGLIMAQLQDEKPGLPYFDPDFTGEYPAEAPFTISELERIYPAASARSKEDEAFAARAHEETFRLQHGERGERALWQHILRVSVEDLKRNYDDLGVSFDVWLGESDAQKYIPQMLETVKAKGLCVESEGALVVPVQEETDAKEVPPCILVKSDGATLYATTDLATIVQREQDYHPKKYMYLTDKRQNLHFEQIFRVAKKAGLVGPETALGHIGFGTMNGKDGKPFKTRAGGVMRLETLISDIVTYVTDKIRENQTVPEDELDATARCIANADRGRDGLRHEQDQGKPDRLRRRAAADGEVHRDGRAQIRRSEQHADEGLRVRPRPVLLVRGQYGALYPLHHRADQVDPGQIRQARLARAAAERLQRGAEAAHAGAQPDGGRAVVRVPRFRAEHDLRVYLRACRRGKQVLSRCEDHLRAR